MKELNDLRVELDVKELEVRSSSSSCSGRSRRWGCCRRSASAARRLNASHTSRRWSALKEEAKLTTGLCAQVGGF